MGGLNGITLNDIHWTSNGKTWYKNCSQGLFMLNYGKKCVDEISCKYVYNNFVDNRNLSCVNHCGESNYIYEKNCITICPDSMV